MYLPTLSVSHEKYIEIHSRVYKPHNFWLSYIYTLQTTQEWKCFPLFSMNSL